MRGYVFDALAIDPDLAAVADRIPVLLSGADHRRSLWVTTGTVATIERDRYPFSSRICTLGAIIGKLDPEPVREPLPPPKVMRRREPP